MKATVTTYGGDRFNDGVMSVKHWQLHVDDVFIADTSIDSKAGLFERIAERINQPEGNNP